MLLPHLEDMLGKFKGTILERPGEISLRTKEGSKVVKETIEYLKNLKPDPAQPDLQWSDDI